MLRMLVGGAAKGGGRASAPRGGPKRAPAKRSPKKAGGPKKKPGGAGGQKKSAFDQGGDEEFGGFDEPLGYGDDSEEEEDEV